MRITLAKLTICTGAAQLSSASPCGLLCIQTEDFLTGWMHAMRDPHRREKKNKNSGKFHRKKELFLVCDFVVVVVTFACVDIRCHMHMEMIIVILSC